MIYLGALDLKKNNEATAVPMIHIMEPMRITLKVKVVRVGSSVSGTA